MWGWLARAFSLGRSARWGASAWKGIKAAVKTKGWDYLWKGLLAWDIGSMFFSFDDEDKTEPATSNMWQFFAPDPIRDHIMNSRCANWKVDAKLFSAEGIQLLFSSNVAEEHNIQGFSYIAYAQYLELSFGLTHLVEVDDAASLKDRLIDVTSEMYEAEQDVPAVAGAAAPAKQTLEQIKTEMKEALKDVDFTTLGEREQSMFDFLLFCMIGWVKEVQVEGGAQ